MLPNTWTSVAVLLQKLYFETQQVIFKLFSLHNFGYEKYSFLFWFLLFFKFFLFLFYDKLIFLFFFKP